VLVLGSEVIGSSELEELVAPVGASYESLVFPVLLGQTLSVSIEFPEIVALQGRVAVPSPSGPGSTIQAMMCFNIPQC
jgi:hypothetical protein